MRKTLTSVIALGFAVTSTTAVLADDDNDDDIDTMAFAEDQQRFSDAGFEGAQVMHGLEVARVTHDGETFYVVKGLDRAGGTDAAGMGAMGTQAGDLGATGQQDPLATDPAAPGQQDQLATDPAAPGQQDQMATDPAAPGQQDQLATDPGAPGTDDQLADDPTTPGIEDDLAAEPGAPGAGDQLAADPAMPGAEDPLATDPAAPGQQDQMATDPGAGVAGAGTDMAGWDARTLEEILEEAGIEEYEILDDVQFATTRMGEGPDAGEVVVIYGFDDEDDEES